MQYRLGQDNDCVPSSLRTLASGSGTTLACGFPKDFTAGEHVVLFGAGGGSTQQAPGAPTLTLPFSDPSNPVTVRYCAIAIGEDRDYSVAGPVVECTASSAIPNVTVDFTPSAVPTNAHLLLVYRQRGNDPWQACAGLVANAHRFRDPILVSEPVRCQFVDGGATLNGLAAWFPSTPPAVAGRKHLRTRIAAIGNGLVEFIDHVVDPVTNATLAHDSYAPLQAAIQRGDEIAIPRGTWEVHGRIRVNNVVTIDGEGPETSLLRFWDGWGIEVEGPDTCEVGCPGGRNSVLSDLGLTYINQSTLPAGNPVILESDPGPTSLLPNRAWPGCLLLVTTRCVLDRVWTTNVRGTGIVFWGWPVRQDGSAHSNCNLSSAYDCSASSAIAGHGMFIRGSDANQINLVAPNVVNNEGWGIYDRSFLGCKLDAAHASNNDSGAYRSDGNVCASTWVGCYSEANQPPSWPGTATVVTGGDHGAGFVPGHTALLHLRASGVGAQPYIHTTQANGESSVQIGQPQTSNKELLRFASHPNDPNARKLKHVTARRDQDVVSRYYDTTAYEAERWYGRHARGPGLLHFPRGFLLGPAGSEKLVAGYNGTLSERRAYVPGDVLIDVAVGQVRTPIAPFALGIARTNNKVTRIGETCVPPTANGFGYVCVSGTGDSTGTYGVTAAQPPAFWTTTIGATFVDGSVTWRCHGADTPQFGAP